MNNTWRFKGNELKYLTEVIDSGSISGTEGNMNQRFETAFAEEVGVKWAITFNSGTSTLHAALEAAGVGAGDEVIMPPLTVISNLTVTIAQNAIPVFADIEHDTFNIDPLDIERRITSKTKAIMPVSLYGLSCDLNRINSIAKEYNLVVINDAAEAYGATCAGQPIATMCDITSYSLENSKHLATGDGGIVVTNDEQMAVDMRKFGSLGYSALTSGDGRIRVQRKLFQDPTYSRHDTFAYNYRMPELAAAVGLAQLERIEEFLELREMSAGLYEDVVRTEDCGFLVPQKKVDGYRNTYWSYALTFENSDISWYQFRDKFMELGGDGIYAAWTLLYNEELVKSGQYKSRYPEIYSELEFPPGTCPVAESVQSKLMQFVTNYGSKSDAMQAAECLQHTIRYFV